MKVSIVVPTYNERENVKQLIPLIFQIFKENKINGNVIIVDDNSPDGTAKVIKKLQEKYPIILIERPKKMGLGSAYIAGFKKALENESDVIFEMDSDLSHDPTEIPNFIEKINDGFDLVVGSRRAEGGESIGRNWHRKLISWGGSFVGKRIAGINNVNDIPSGYRAYKKDVLKRIDLEGIKSSGFAFQLETLGKCIKTGSKVSVIPIIFRERYSGKSKFSMREILSFFLTAIKLRLS